jgi:hypothetical protein
MPDMLTATSIQSMTGVRLSDLNIARIAEDAYSRARCCPRTSVTEPSAEHVADIHTDALAKHRSTNFGLGEKRPLGDASSPGDGTIDGRDVPSPTNPHCE